MVSNVKIRMVILIDAGTKSPKSTVVWDVLRIVTVSLETWIISWEMCEEMLSINRMPHNRLPKVMKQYSPTGRRNHGRPLKRLLVTWDRNGSTSGPTPWQIDDDDDDTYNRVLNHLVVWLRYWWLVSVEKHLSLLCNFVLFEGCLFALPSIKIFRRMEE